MENNFQKNVGEWCKACFGEDSFSDDRPFRFLEESIELVQALNVSKDDVLKLVDYVYSRPVGDIEEEIGGTMLTLAALCNSLNLSMYKSALNELQKVWNKIEQIRAKNKNKLMRDKTGPLPGSI